MKTTKNTGDCDCKNGHTDQITDFPVGTEVQALFELSGAVKRGDKGVVLDHCADGRAFITFGPHTHTFHFPDDYIRVVDEPALACYWLKGAGGEMLMPPRIQQLTEHEAATMNYAYALNGSPRLYVKYVQQGLALFAL